jgi:hypothetical protein
LSSLSKYCYNGDEAGIRCNPAVTADPADVSPAERQQNPTPRCGDEFIRQLITFCRMMPAAGQAMRPIIVIEKAHPSINKRRFCAFSFKCRRFKHLKEGHFLLNYGLRKPTPTPADRTKSKINAGQAEHLKDRHRLN